MNTTRSIRTLALVSVALCTWSAGAQAAPRHASAKHGAETNPQTTWAACNTNAGKDVASTFHPLSDAAAAALVTAEPETRPYNAKAYTLDGVSYPATNDFVPSLLAVAIFRATKNSYGQTAVQANPYLQYVDGRDGIKDPSTDDLIQWAAHKWGIPENWLRAEYAVESYWNSFQLGDEETVSASDYSKYPLEARIPGTSEVYQSMGITQVRWNPEGTNDPGTNPLRWASTAFNIDYQAATIRFYYDDPDGARTAWGDSSYAPCNQWLSLGGWYDPYPWNNSGQASYISQVQSDLSDEVWTTSSFLTFTPTSFPPGVSFS